MKVFAEVGQSLQQVGGECPDGWIVMQGQRPEAYMLAQADGTWGAPATEWPRFVGNEKLDLFTPSEQLAVVAATMTDPMVKLAYDRLIGAAFWTYEDPETEQGLAMLESKGIITAARKAQIVAAMQPK